MSVVENVVDACEQLGQVDLSGIKLESASPLLLNPSIGEIDEHVSMQPGAIAYYGSLLKESKRSLVSYKKSYERWERKKYAEAKVAANASSTNKCTVDDIKARYITDNETEIEKWEEGLDRLQMEADTLEVWYEAWRQKSFSIREHVNVTEDERWSSSSSMTAPSGLDAELADVFQGAANAAAKYPGESESQKSKKQKVRDIMNKKRQKGAQGKQTGNTH